MNNTFNNSPRAYKPADFCVSDYSIEDSIWKEISPSIPKILYFLGYDMSHFFNFGMYVQCTSITLNKIRSTAYKFNLHPLEYLLYSFYNLSCSPGYFVRTIFGYMNLLDRTPEWTNYIHSHNFPKIFFAFYPISMDKH